MQLYQGLQFALSPAHFDGSYTDEKTGEISFYTLHLYLNDSTSADKLDGGSTVFHSWGDTKQEIGVEPKAGRVLIFQHDGLLHSGGEVRGGVKLTMRTDLLYKKVG